MAKRSLRKPARRSSTTPLISFTFDDFPRSAWLVGGRMLSEYGARGTYYSALRLLGTTTEVGKIAERADLENIVDAGHELACHTVDHVSCRFVATSEFVSRCAVNRKLAATMLQGYHLRNFSFPHGDITVAGKCALLGVYDTCRSIEPGINPDPVDLGMLRANRVYSRENVEHARKLIRCNVARRGWLIFYTHDVEPSPSPYGCTPEFFEEILRYAFESGSRILSIREAAAEYEPQPIL